MIDVAALDDLAVDAPVRVDVDGRPVCLVRTADGVAAVHDVCTHAKASMSEGWVDDGVIECPRHGARFRLDTGEVVTPPASAPLPTFTTEVRDGRVLVDPTPSRPHPFSD